MQLYQLASSPPHRLPNSPPRDLPSRRRITHGASVHYLVHHLVTVTRRRVSLSDHVADLELKQADALERLNNLSGAYLRRLMVFGALATWPVVVAILSTLTFKVSFRYYSVIIPLLFR